MKNKFDWVPNLTIMERRPSPVQMSLLPFVFNANDCECPRIQMPTIDSLDFPPFELLLMYSSIAPDVLNSIS